MTIASIHALEILDSRGNPTLEVIVKTDNGFIGKAAVPSGASTGEYEALELRDGDKKRYFGKGVLKAIQNVNGPLTKAILGMPVNEQALIDKTLIEADGTQNKSKFGANAMLGISLATAKAAAASSKQPLYLFLGGKNATTLPCPMMNILNGGAHANNGLDFQEFMIRPIGFPSFKEALRAGCEIFHTLKTVLKKKGYSTAVGDEGGFAPCLSSHEEALDLIMHAIEKSGYLPKTQITLALDCAASEFYDKASRKYQGKTSSHFIEYLEKLCNCYPIDSIEDPLDQNDWESWIHFTKILGKKIQIVGDDIFVTNPKFLQKGIDNHVANAILIKLNQIGTLTETLDTIALAKSHGYKTIISHRSGETEDTIIADIAVAASCLQIKTGSLSRSDRVAKYNRLLEIEYELGSQAKWLMY